MNFKIGIAKFLSNNQEMKIPSVSLQSLKNNFKVIKDICKENASGFKNFN